MSGNNGGSTCCPIPVCLHIESVTWSEDAVTDLCDFIKLALSECDCGNNDNEV